MGTIVDVRTREEFVGGHIQNSINIPLQEITNHIEEIKTMEEQSFFVVPVGCEAVMQQTILALLVLLVKMVVDG